MIHSFFVKGIPSPGGSKSFMGIAKKTGRAILVDAGGAKTKKWRNDVERAARDYMKSLPLFCGPIKCDFVFFINRPKYHFTKKGKLKASAPAYHTKAPDALKLARSTEDALKNIVWNDDCQVVNGSQKKAYADKRCSGCLITITEDSKRFENDPNY